MNAGKRIGLTGIIAAFCVIGLMFVLASWKGKGIRYGLHPPPEAHLYPLTKVGRVCLFLMGMLLLGRAIVDIIQRT